MNKTTSELKTQRSCQEAKRKQLSFLPALGHGAESPAEPFAHLSPAAGALVPRWWWLSPHGCSPSGAEESRREVEDPKSLLVPCRCSKGSPRPPLGALELGVVGLGWHKTLQLPAWGQNQSQKLGSLWGTGTSEGGSLCSKINVSALCIRLSRGLSHLPLQNQTTHTWNQVQNQQRCKFSFTVSVSQPYRVGNARFLPKANPDHLCKLLLYHRTSQQD